MIWLVFEKKGINELNLNDFIHGGLRITGFSLVDYYNINVIKMISEISETNNPINKIPNIPVSNDIYKVWYIFFEINFIL